MERKHLSNLFVGEGGERVMLMLYAYCVNICGVRCGGCNHDTYRQMEMRFFSPLELPANNRYHQCEPCHTLMSVEEDAENVEANDMQ